MPTVFEVHMKVFHIELMTPIDFGVSGLKVRGHSNFIIEVCFRRISLILFIWLRVFKIIIVVTHIELMTPNDFRVSWLNSRSEVTMILKFNNMVRKFVSGG